MKLRKRITAGIVVVCTIITSIPLSGITTQAAEQTDSFGQLYDELVDSSVKESLCTSTETITPKTDEVFIYEEYLPKDHLSGADGFQGSDTTGNITWSVTDGVLTITGTGEMDNYGETENPSPWNHDNSIKSIVIEDGVTGIGDWAFIGCTGLKSVLMPDSLRRIGIGAFHDCETLQEATFPEGLTSIDSWAFFHCFELENIELPSTMTELGGAVFDQCLKLEEISIPSGIVKIEHNPFVACPNLSKITVSSENAKYDSRNNCNAIIETETNTLVSGCVKTIIPDDVTSIEWGAFDGIDLVSIIIPEGVKTIGTAAFGNKTLVKKIVLPNNVTFVDVYAFHNCINLNSFTFSFGQTEISEGTLQDCTQLKSVYMPETIIKIGADAFKNCIGLKDIYFSGNEEKWNSIQKAPGWDNNADDYTVHFNSVFSNDENWECEIIMPDGIPVAGNPFTIRADLYTGSVSANVIFTLPDNIQLVEHSISVNGEQTEPEIESTGFKLDHIGNDVIRFTVIATDPGDYSIALKALVKSKTYNEKLDFTALPLFLTLPTITSIREIPVSGTAIPGGTIEFLEESSEIGTATVNEIGGFRTTLLLSDKEGEHTIFARIIRPNGSNMLSDPYKITYDQDRVQISTLTVNNAVPGGTEADDDIGQSFVIDYASGNRSNSYYTYSPDCPLFTFTVDFLADGAKKVSEVSVITANNLGEEITVPLSYVNEKWQGSYSYTEYTVPCSFRVDYSENTRNKNYIYDEKGRVTGVKGDEGKLKINYNSDDTISSVLLPDGSEMQCNYVYDPVSREMKIESATTGEYTYNYDLDNNHVKAIDEKGEQTDIYYNDDNLVTQIAYPDDTNIKMDYKNDGSIVMTANDEDTISYSLKDGKLVADGYRFGKTVLSSNSLKAGSYSEYKELSDSDYMFKIELINGNDLNYVLDSDGRVKEVTDTADNSYKYVRNTDNFVTDMVFPDAKAEKYEYDSKGHVVKTITRSGKEIECSYDEKDNITCIEYSADDKVLYEYDDGGRLTSINENGSITSVTYDGKGNPVKVQYPDNKTISYEYDEKDRLVSITDNEGYKTGYTYTDKDYLNTVTDGNNILISYTYDDTGRKIRQDNANGTYTTYTYSDNTLSAITHYGTSGEIISSYEYTYNEDQKISSLKENGTDDWQYSYDELGQLIKVDAPDGAVTTYSYDAAGNRRTVVKNGETTNYVSNSLNQYTVVGESIRSYDDDGYLISEEKDGKTALYEWDLRGRLIKYTDFDGKVYEYGYDAFGLRNAVSVNGEKTSYLNSPLGCGFAITSYENGNDVHYTLAESLAVSRTEEGKYFYNANHLGSVTEITDEDGAIANCYKYDPEGNIRSSTENINNPYTYVGIYGVVNDRNGLIYDRARYISSETDSFINMDPAGQSYDLNMYCYAYNDQVNYIDLTGKWTLQSLNLIMYNARSFAINYSKNAIVLNPYLAQHIVSIFSSKDPKGPPNGSGGSGGSKKPGGPGLDLNAMVAHPKDRLQPLDDWWRGISLDQQTVLYTTLTAIALIALALVFKAALVPALGGALLVFLLVGLPGDMSKAGMAANDEQTQTAIVHPNMDPSGFVYETYENNRLQGVTTTLYYSDVKPDEGYIATDSQVWNAGAYDQVNPLVTDALGQYKWMVPVGWWQVKYEKEGYETNYSNWLPVPPVQTDVNIMLTSYDEAVMTVSTSRTDGRIVIRFSHPVVTASVNIDNLGLSYEGRPLAGNIIPLNAGTNAGGKLCATTFYFEPSIGVPQNASIKADYHNIVTGSGTVCDGTIQGGSIHVSSVSLDKNSVSLRVGEKITLSAKLTPSDASNKEIEWFSSNLSVAAVSEGTITGIAAGNAVITAKTVDGGFTATCDVEVRKNKSEESPTGPVKADTSKYINDPDIIAVKSMNVKKTLFSGIKGIKSFSVAGDEEAISLTKRGILSIKGIGTVTITAYDKNREKLAEKTIKVSFPKTGESKMELNRKGTYDMNQLVDSNIMPTRWKSSNSKIAEVDKTGLLTAKKSGKIKVYAYYEGEKYTKPRKLTYTIKIKIPQFAKKTYTVKTGKTKKTSVKYKPHDTEIIYSVENEEIATVDDRGIITGVNKGLTELYAEINGIKYSTKIKVK